MTQTKLTISTFADEQDGFPARGEATWEQLVDGLRRVRSTPCTLTSCTRSDCAHKAAAAWSPAYFPAGARRRLNTLEGVSAFVVDLDHVAPTALGDALAKVTRYQTIIHGSHSDHPNDRCLRVIIAISRPVLPVEWPRFWRAGMLALGLPADEQTKDGTRLYYRPSRPGDACADAPDGSGYVFETTDGPVLDVDAILATAPAAAELDVVMFDDYEVPEFQGAPPEEQMFQAAQVLADAWPTKGRHEAQRALSGALARAGWPVDLIAQFCAGVAHIQQPGNADLHKRYSAARSSFEKAQTGCPVQGWPSLEGAIGKEPVDKARKLLGFESSPEPMTGEDLDGIAFIIEVSKARAAEIAANAPAPTTNDLTSTLKAEQKRLSRANDATSLANGELLRRVIAGQFLTDNADENALSALVKATMLVCGIVYGGGSGSGKNKVKPLPSTTPKQITERLMSSAGGLVDKLPEIVDSAIARVKPVRGEDATDSERRSILDEEWDLNQFGKKIPASPKNMKRALAEFGVEVAYNELRMTEMVACTSLTINSGPLTDAIANTLRHKIDEQSEFLPDKGEFWDLLSYQAHENAFHPVKDYFTSLPAWDGVSRTESWLVNFFGADDTEFNRAIARIVIVAAVRRAVRPGCKFDEMLVLEGPQGGGKSTGLAALCPNREWFTDVSPLGQETRRQMEITAGKWIIEAGELDGLSRKEDGAVKAFLSRLVDEARMAYDRKPTWVPRQCIIIGTVNDSRYLKDPTGARRSWPVKVGTVNVPGIVAARDQLWAEAYALDLAHPEESYIRLDPSLYEAAAAEQDKRRVVSAFDVMLRPYFEGLTGRVLTDDVWKLIGVGGTDSRPRPSSPEMADISKTMTAMGYVHGERKLNGRNRYFYMRGTKDEMDVVIKITGNAMQGWSVDGAAVDGPANANARQLPSPTAN